MSKVAKAFGDFSSPVSVALYTWQKSLRSRRKAKGCSSTRELSQLVENATGVSIKHDALMRIENGWQIPSAEQFMAINHALTGKPFPRFKEIDELTDAVGWLRRQEECL